MDLYEKLSRVQEKLKAPKNQYNDFGGYKYRSCEDIVEAVKPLLAEEGLVMTISDELKLIGDRYYIKATVAVICSDSGEKHEVNGYAREAENKKGMDVSQITGASSSYARKYALNGMFAIDDTKDADDYKDYLSELRKLYGKNEQKVKPVITSYLQEKLNTGNLEKMKSLSKKQLKELYNKTEEVV